LSIVATRDHELFARIAHELTFRKVTCDELLQLSDVDGAFADVNYRTRAIVLIVGGCVVRFLTCARNGVGNASYHDSDDDDDTPFSALGIQKDLEVYLPAGLTLALICFDDTI
jgi:hypothetical protein